ncbi:MAG: 16S rRNA (adenine(1518)-N(6)/adenine(1519)-N(6))-dimethyltransferase RsmA [Fidelibacterota bacterium]
MTRRFRKRWGQHFLRDTNLLDKVVRIIGPRSTDSVLEVGPGEGALTELLAPRVKELIGVEIDADLVQALVTHPGLDRCTFIQGDVLAVDLSNLPFKEFPVRVVGNIPYGITSPLIFALLEHPGRWKDIHFMVQQEVAERLTASPGSKVYGRLTVMVQSAADVEEKLRVPPEVFAPRPTVRSALVSIRPHRKFGWNRESRKAFGVLVKHAFSQRRKMLKNSLAVYPWEEIPGFDFTRRPESVSVEEFVDLSLRFREGGFETKDEP